MGIRADAPLVCPYCDELSYAKKMTKRILLPNKVYTKRQCIMGHEFYSVETIPEDQDAIELELREVKKDANAWRRELRNIRE